MRIRKILALTLAMVLVFGTFTFGYGTEDLSNTNAEVTQEKLEDSTPVENPGDPDANDDQGDEDQKVDPKNEKEKENQGNDDEWIPEDPDNLGKPVEIKSPKLFKPQAEPKMGAFKIAQNSEEEMNNVTDGNPGDVFLTKSAIKVDDECNLWDVELTLTGINGEQTSDTVLVIDRSGSMDDGNKFTNAKNAAKSFVDLVLDGTNDSNHRIAVMSFSSGTTQEIGFSSDNTDVKDAIDDIANPYGGTHTQAAMRQAGMVIEAVPNNDKADSQNIILLSDGEATYSYEIKNRDTHATDEFNPSNYGYNDNNDKDYRTTYLVPENDFDYGITVGDGTSGHTRFYNTNKEDRYYRHGASAVAEAGFIDNEVNIYTISLQNNAEGEWTLDNIADTGNNYSTSGSDLSAIYQEIAGSINYAATNAVITDVLGTYFDIPGINASNYNSLIDVSRGSLSWDNNTETITWDLGNISASDPATMTYQVAMDPSGFGMGMLPTNEDAYVEYTDLEENQVSEDFPKPKAEMTCEFGELTIIKKIFVDGEEVLEDDEEFEFTVNGQTVTASVNQHASVSLLTGDYTVEEVNYGDWVPDEVSQDVSVTTDGASLTFTNRYTTPKGDLTIEKEVYIDGELDEGNQTVFEFEVNGEVVTASAVESGVVTLPVGTYTVEETGYGDYTPDATTQQAVVTPNGGIVTFVNRYTTPTGNLTIEKDVYIDGELDEGNQTVFEFEVNGEVVTASAVESGVVTLPVGTYTVEETGYSYFTPDFTTTVVSITTEGTTLTFSNRYETPDIPAMSIEKVADDYSVFIGEDVTYTITVTNTGEGDLENVLVIDAQLGYSNTVTIPEGGTFVDTITNSYGSTGAKVNTARAEYQQGELVVEDSVTVNVNRRPVVEEDYTVTTDVDPSGSGTTTGDGTYEEGDEVTVTASPNSGYVFINWTNESDDVVSTNSEYTFTMPDEDVELTANFEIEFIEEPSLTINKTVDDDTVYVDEEVTYTIEVTNNGNIDLENVVVIDEFLDFEETIALLQVGETEIFELTTSYETTGDKVNTATAEYEDITVEDSVTVDVNRRSTPERNTYRMTIEKEANGEFFEVGDTITYTIVVENTGNTRLADITVVDEMLGLDEEINYLYPDQTAEFVETYEVQEDDIGTLTNTATAEDDRAGTEEATEVVTVEDVPESVPGTYEMTIEKTALVEGEIYFGDMVEFTIVVTNTGDETIENILVEDDMVDFEATIDELAPGESEEFTVMVEAPNIPGPFTNTATASSSETGILEAEDTVFVEEPVPLDVPDTGVAPTDLFFGLGALVSGLGVFFTKKRK